MPIHQCSLKRKRLSLDRTCYSVAMVVSGSILLNFKGHKRQETELENHCGVVAENVKGGLVPYTSLPLSISYTEFVLNFRPERRLGSFNAYKARRMITLLHALIAMTQSLQFYCRQFKCKIYQKVNRLPTRAAYCFRERIFRATFSI